MDNKLNILVVDDDEKVGRMFADVFKDDGHNVNSVTSGEDALDAYRRNPTHLVFLDMILPGMNGLETLKALKNIDANICVVLMTGYSVLGMLEDASKLGVVTTLIKPFYIDKVKQAVEQSRIKASAAEQEKEYGVLIIDEWMGLAGKLKPVLKEMDFAVYTCVGIDQLKAILQEKGKEFDLILISISILERDVMGVFNYMKETMPTSKCIMLIDEYMNIEEISNNIRELFSK